VGKKAHHVLELLKLGRGVIAGLLLEMRTDISEIERRHPVLAIEFVFFRDELDSPIHNAAAHSALGRGLGLIGPKNLLKYTFRRFLTGFGFFSASSLSAAAASRDDEAAALATG